MAHSTSAGSLYIDGVGCTRIYYNMHRGRQSVAVANSSVKKAFVSRHISGECDIMTIVILSADEVLTESRVLCTRPIASDVHWH